jgi:hypothetical protein
MKTTIQSFEGFARQLLHVLVILQHVSQHGCEHEAKGVCNAPNCGHDLATPASTAWRYAHFVSWLPIFLPRLQTRCCVVKTGANARVDLHFTFSDCTHLNGRCICTDDGLRPIQTKLYDMIKNENPEDEFPAHSGLRICDTCRLELIRWKGVPLVCVLCSAAVLKDETRALSSFAQPDSTQEESSTRVCKPCYSQRVHAVNAVKNPPVATPTKAKEAAGGWGRGRPSRAVSGMSGPVGAGISRGPICSVPDCDGEVCKHKGMHLEHVVGIVEMPIFLRILARVRCAHAGGTCSGLMEPLFFKHGNVANAQIDIRCADCQFTERIQLQRDLLKEWSADKVPEKLPDRTEQSKRPNAIPVPAGDSYGGATRAEVKQIIQNNTEAGLKIAIGAACANIKLRALAEGLAKAGIVLPGDNVKKGGIERIIVGSAAEATKTMEDLMKDHLERRATGEGPTLGSIKHIICEGDNGWSSAHEGSNSA